MVSYSDEPCIEMVIFLYVPSVLVRKRFVMDGGRGWGRDHAKYYRENCNCAHERLPIGLANQRANLSEYCA